MNQYLREARENTGLTQWQVAEKASVSVMTYQRYEYGKRQPRVQTAIRIAKALNRPIETLFKGYNKESPDGNQAKHESCTV